MLLQLFNYTHFKLNIILMRGRIKLLQVKNLTQKLISVYLDDNLTKRDTKQNIATQSYLKQTALPKNHCEKLPR